MPEVARCGDAAVVEVGDGRGVDMWGEGQGRTDEAVLKLGDQVCLPLEALDLPGAECESGDWNESLREVLVLVSFQKPPGEVEEAIRRTEEEEARAMFFPRADELRRLVDERDEVRFFGGIATGVAGGRRESRRPRCPLSKELLELAGRRRPGVAEGLDEAPRGRHGGGELQWERRAWLLAGTGDDRSSHDVKCGGKLSASLIVAPRQGPPKRGPGRPPGLVAPLIVLTVIRGLREKKCQILLAGLYSRLSVTEQEFLEGGIRHWAQGTTERVPGKESSHTPPGA